jgi:hypothetical protein
MGGEEIGEAVWRGLSIVPKASAHVFAVLVKSYCDSNLKSQFVTSSWGGRRI